MTDKACTNSQLTQMMLTVLQVVVINGVLCMTGPHPQ